MGQQGLRFATPDIDAERRPDGALVLRSRADLPDHEERVGAWLERWADERPDTVFLAERPADGAGGDVEATWRELTYGEARERARAVGQALLDRGLGPDRPLLLLSGNSIDHAVLALGAQLVGVPAVPTSPAYCLMADDYTKIVDIAREIRPGLVFADRAAPYTGALTAFVEAGLDVTLVTSGDAVVRADGGADREEHGEADGDGNGAAHPGSSSPWGERLTLAELTSVHPGEGYERAAAAVGPDTVAKILYTSGSTGVPKGVVNTHRMLCANQRQLRAVWPFLDDTPVVLLDWLPWNHTFGGNHDFNLVLANGGTLYLDDGKPAPALIGRTVRNLRAVSPTIYFNVPAGYGALLPHLEADDGLAAAFFDRLELIFYAGAALPQDLWERLEAVSQRVLGRTVPMTSSWGSTETAPLATAAHFPLERAGNIGVPVPGVELKLVPAEGKLEVRVRGPNVTPGYVARPERTAEAFDDEGFYRIGDAVRFADPDDPSKGLLFDGRVAEDFKLLTGTKVPAGQLRVQTVAAMSPLVSDAVVTGHDRDRVGLLVWLNAGEAARMAGDDADDPATLAASAAVRDHLRAGVERHNAAQKGSSTTVRRLLVLTEPPSFDAGEITDKGYINQRAVLERRADDVARLYAEDPDGDVLVF